MLVEIVPPTESQSGVAGFCVAKMATVCFNGRDSATLSEGPSVSRSGVAVFHVDRTDTEQGDPLKRILRLKNNNASKFQEHPSEYYTKNLRSM